MVLFRQLLATGRLDADAMPQPCPWPELRRALHQVGEAIRHRARPVAAITLDGLTITATGTGLASAPRLRMPVRILFTGCRFVADPDCDLADPTFDLHDFELPRLEFEACAFEGLAPSLRDGEITGTLAIAGSSFAGVLRLASLHIGGDLRLHRLTRQTAASDAAIETSDCRIAGNLLASMADGTTLHAFDVRRSRVGGDCEIAASLGFSNRRAAADAPAHLLRLGIDDVRISGDLRLLDLVVQGIADEDGPTGLRRVAIGGRCAIERTTWLDDVEARFVTVSGGVTLVGCHAAGLLAWKQLDAAGGGFRARESSQERLSLSGARLAELALDDATVAQTGQLAVEFSEIARLEIGIGAGRATGAKACLTGVRFAAFTGLLDAAAPDGDGGILAYLDAGAAGPPGPLDQTVTESFVTALAARGDIPTAEAVAVGARRRRLAVERRQASARLGAWWRDGRTMARVLPGAEEILE